MNGTAYLARAFLWTIPAYAAWELLEPLNGQVVRGLATAVLTLGGHPARLVAQPTNRSAVLLIALVLAHRPPWRRAIAGVVIGSAACLAAEALAIAVFVGFPTDDTVPERFMRGVAFGLDKATPIAAWLLLARPQIAAALARPPGAAGMAAREPERRKVAAPHQK